MTMSQRPSTIATHELNVLLVEPDEETRRLLELALQARGHQVTSGGDAVGAWRALQRLAYPLIIVNRRLPDVDGLRLCRQMRAVPNGAESVILIVSGGATTEERAAALEAGADDYLAWPDDAVSFRGHLEAVEQRAAQAEHVQAQAQSALHPAAVRDTLFVLNPDGVVRATGEAAETLLGYSAATLHGRNAFAMFHPDDAPQVLGTLAQVLSGNESSAPAAFRVRGHDDAWHELELTARNSLHDPEIGGIVLSVRLPEPEPAAAEPAPVEERQLGLIYDELTRLPTYTLFADRLEHALARASRRGEPVVVLALALDGLEDADARYGAGADEQLIVSIGQRAQSCLRAGDTVARVGPHEFGFIIEGVLGLGDATPIAQRIVRDLEEPITVNGQSATLTPQIGVSMSAQERYSAADLLRQARAARDYARHHPVVGGHYALYESSMDHPAAHEVSPSDLLDEAQLTLDAPDAPAEAWFSPLLERINSLEREIARLTTEQQRPPEDHDEDADED
jgi:diguanylate cyclase (GGDEF)-like protein/PAS domain S-box-containing protein